MVSREARRPRSRSSRRLWPPRRCLDASACPRLASCAQAWIETPRICTGEQSEDGPRKANSRPTSVSSVYSVGQSLCLNLDFVSFVNFVVICLGKPPLPSACPRPDSCAPAWIQTPRILTGGQSKDGPRKANSRPTSVSSVYSVGQSLCLNLNFVCFVCFVVIWLGKTPLPSDCPRLASCAQGLDLKCPGFEPESNPRSGRGRPQSWSLRAFRVFARSLPWS